MNELRQSLEELRKQNVLSTESDNCELTPLGKVVASIPVEIPVAKVRFRHK